MNASYKSPARVLFAALILTLVPLVSVEAQSTPDSSLPARRIGLFVGANQGGAERQALLWAVRDSKRMSELMQELGGMAPSDTWQLADPDSATFRKTLGKVSTVLGAEKHTSKRMEFMFYYSGHSNEQGLLLKDGQIAYQEIKDALKASNADISIVMLDSCSSGSFTRSKGGARVKPFLYDDSINMKGYAYITSSSADEAAQESDRLGASFFTHFMISGLRGAADRNLDGRVNMNEAYEYAFQETLASTGSSKDGPQHPSYDIQLKGSGELILSDLSQPSAAIVLGEDLEGRVFIRDTDKNLVIELGKTKGRVLSLALQPGTYTVRLETGTGSLESTVILGDRKTVGVSLGDFKNAPRITNRPRGDSGTPETAAEPAEGAPQDKPAEKAAKKDLEKAAEELGLAAVEFANDTTTNILNDLRDRFNEHKKALEPATSSATGASPAGDTEDSGEGIAEEPATPREFVPFNLSFVPGLGIFPDGENTESLISLGVLLAQTGHSLALMSSGIGNISLHEVFGLQAAGIFNTASDVLGVQTSGIFNMASGAVSGVQAGGVFNTADGTVTGLQAGGLFNIAGGIQGVQGAGLFNVARADVTGIQGAGLFNSSAKTQGVQAAGLFNLSTGMDGLQAAGLFNSTGDLKGLQAAGLFNNAQTMDGIQVAGLFNHVGTGKGMQIGLVNVGDSLEGLPIGLLNLYKEGIHDLSYWYSLQDRHWIGIDSGTDMFYSGIYAGYFAGTPIEELAGLSLGVCTGLRLHEEEFFFDANMNVERYATGNTAEQRLISLFTEPAIHLVPGIRLQAGFDFDIIIASVGLDIKGLFPLVGEVSEYFALDQSNYMGFGWTSQIFGTTAINWIKVLPLFKVTFSI